MLPYCEKALFMCKFCAIFVNFRFISSLLVVILIPLIHSSLETLFLFLFFFIFIFVMQQYGVYQYNVVGQYGLHSLGLGSPTV